MKTNMFLFAFVFLLVVFFAVLPLFSGEIAKKVSKLWMVISDEEMNLKSQIKEFKAEQGTISMTDEFAKYAKLQRKIDKIMNQLKQFSSERKKKFTMISLGVKISIYVLNALTMLTLVISNWNSPVLLFPAGWFYPFHRFVAAPTGIPGALGITGWILISSATVYRIKRQFVC